MNKPKKSKKKPKTKKRLIEKHKKRSKKEKQNKKDRKRLRDLQIPVERTISKCQLCEEEKADFYCTKCEVHYCQNCELQLHTHYLKKKHFKFVFKEPYIQRKVINTNKCEKHQEKLSLYCKDENKLICTECYETCRKNNHSILGLNEYSNEISEKIKIIINKIQKEELQNNETIKQTLVNQNKLKQETKELVNYIENESNLLIQKIQKTKINYLNLLKKVEIISNTNFTKILNEKKIKQKKINQNKSKIKKLKKLKKDKKKIKLIQGSKEIIQKREREKKREIQISKRKREKKENREDNECERKRKVGRGKEKKEEIKEEREEEEEDKKEAGADTEIYKEEFDPKMKENLIKLKNEKKTAMNPSKYGYGKICGKKIYSSGKHEIKIKIDQFPNPKNKTNIIYLGVIKTENREKLIEKKDYEGTYYFQIRWNGKNKKKMQSLKYKKENGKGTGEGYPVEIYFKKDDIFTISLDMDIKKISFKINEKNLTGWENLPEKVNFFASLRCQKGKEKNKISII
ncbi:hypothetical protein M0812_19436 [Anaeramoeba flamelloides]|uniref:B box-type domain-containing protein n=1 Tax=Anaeramoeba flamelloides TaxID=1746091 RepID=A0AAV7Z3W6_9EUKA|nr:hypothetical protein M0812_19436 [Anaeramoeba flamelloides]